MAAIEIRGLSKTYRRWRKGPVRAVDALSLDVEEGEVVGLLGPNGAGKTTTMQIVLGLLRPDDGDVRVLGGTMADPDRRRLVGFLPDAPMFPKAFRTKEVLEYHAELLGMPRREARRRAAAKLEEAGLADAAERKVAKLSRGMLQRLGFAQATLGEPRLVLLDEPTASLDPAGIAQMREALLAARAGGASVLLSSHVLSEVERVSDRVAFMSEGRLVAVHSTKGEGEGEGPVGLRVRVRLASPPSREILAHVPDATVTGQEIVRTVESEADVAPLVRALAAAGAEIVEVLTERNRARSLEDLYMHHVGVPKT